MIEEKKEGDYMATSKEYAEYIFEQLSDLEGVSHRKMMGEYVVYYREKVAALLCDDRLLVKPVPSAVRLLPDAPSELPYPGGKPMLAVQNVDDREALCRLLREIYDELPAPKKKKK